MEQFIKTIQNGEKIAVPGNTISEMEAELKLSNWNEIVEQLLVTEEPPQTDERVYLTVKTRYASTMVEHLIRYRLARLFAVNKHVLDLCCGCGYGTAILSTVAKTVVGVDYAEDAVAWARRHYNYVHYLVMDAANLRFESEDFDLVVSMEAIEHVYDNDAYLSHVKRVLKPNGQFLFSTPHSSTGKLQHSPHGHHKWSFTHPFLKEQLTKYFGENVLLFSQTDYGFEPLKIPCYYMGVCIK